MKKIILALFMGLFNMLLTAQPTTTSGSGSVKVVTTSTTTRWPNFDPPIWPTPDPVPPGNPGPENPDRGIFWVHGLTKPATATGAWTRPATATQNGATGFAARRVKSFRPTYSQQGNLVTAGTALDGAIRSSLLSSIGTLTGDVDQHFIIAHSQGGLVSRAADQLIANGTISNQPYGGIVTFGTPHAGARIGNNVPQLESELVDVCKQATDPIGPTLFILGFFVPGVVISLIDDPLCDHLPKKLSDFKQPLLADYAIGGPGITALNAGPMNILPDRRVAFVGIETEEVMWREIWHVFNPAGGYPLFGANDSQTGQNTINTVRAIYASAANITDLWPYHWLSDDWQEGLDELLQINNTYKSLIGATSTAVSSTNAYCQCVTTNYDYNHNVTYTQTFNSSGATQSTCASSNITPFSSTVCQWFQDLTFTTVNQPNDGVVVQSSAMAFPGCNQFATMLGSNHQSMRNDLNTGIRLRALFTGGHGNYYITPLRP